MPLTENDLPEGGIFRLSDRELKVDMIDTIAAISWADGTTDTHNIVMVTAAGRFNITDEPGDITLMLSIEGAEALVQHLNHSLAAIPGDDRE